VRCVVRLAVLYRGVIADLPTTACSPFTETCNEVFVGVAARSKLARHVHQRHS